MTEYQYNEQTGLPINESYLEKGLPTFLKESIKLMKKSWDIIDDGKEDMMWDAYWCELNSNINCAEVEQIISEEQAWYLRKKYLRMEREKL